MRSIDLPCEEVFSGPSPKLLLSRLAEIAKDHLRLDGGFDLLVSLPVAQLALAYRFIERREILEEEAPSKAESRNGQDLDLAPAKEEAGEPSPQHNPDVASEGGRSSPAKTSGRTIVDPHPVQATMSPLAPAFKATKELPIDGNSDAGAASAGTLSPHEAPPDNPVNVAGEPKNAPVLEKSSAAPLPSHGELPGAQERGPSSKFELALTEPVAPEAVVPANEPLPAAVQEAPLIKTEHLPASELKAAIEIPDQNTLQAIFMTEEFLSLDRVVELCGGLPGIRSCVLAHGAAVLASHNVPESLDLVSLSAHALEMLAAIRQSAARMGVGAVPAVTIHSEKGPITFFPQPELCLLVLHQDRGFVPGVREKLQQVLEYLSKANLMLPAGASRSPLVSKETTF